MGLPRARSAHEDDDRDEPQRKSSGSHELGLRLPHSLDPEEKVEGPIRRGETDPGDIPRRD